MKPVVAAILIASGLLAPLPSSAEGPITVQPSSGSVAQPQKAPGSSGKPEISKENIAKIIKAERADWKDGKIGDSLIHPEGTRMVGANLVFSTPSSAIPPQMAEALSLLAEIAITRARRQSLSVIHSRLEEAVCGLVLSGQREKVLPQTCALVKGTSLERLAADPEPLALSVTSDLVHAAMLASGPTTGVGDANPSVEEPREMLRIAVQAVARSVVRARPSFTAEDAWNLTSTLLQSSSANRNDGIGLGLRAARVCLKLKQQHGLQAPCDMPYIVRELNNGDMSGAWEKIGIALDISQEAFVALLAAAPAVNNPDVLQPLPRERLRAAVRLMVKTLTSSLNTRPEELARVRLVGDLLIAAIDGSQPRMIVVGAELTKRILLDAKPDNEVALRKAISVLTTVSSYAATYISPTTSESDKEAMRENRKQMLEALIDESTVRTHRSSEWVFTIGSPVGLQSPLFQGRNVLAPQLTLPMGLAVQRLPGERGDPTGRWGLGFHLMFTAVDLGQFLAYRPDGAIQTPTWDSAVSPGAQIGALIGPPDNVLMLGLDFRYARNVFAGTPEGAGPRDPQIHLVLAYYVPFFDFN